MKYTKCVKCNYEIGNNGFKSHITVCNGSGPFAKRQPSSEETKFNNRSNAMKRALASGRHPGWKHINERKDRLSYPERFLKEVLINEGVFSKFTVKQHLSISKYVLDFAILELKLDIEMDGSQHTRTSKAIEHDKIRNEYLIREGWTIYRIAWQQMYKFTKDEIKKLIQFINHFERGLHVYYDVVLKQPVLGLPRGQKVRIKSNEKWGPYKEKIISSGIDFTKFGWVKKVSKILNISPQKVNGWMKQYLPDILEVAFRRVNVRINNASVHPHDTNVLKG